MKKMFLTSLIFGVLLMGCKTTIPPRDTRPPAFIFKIIGDGLNVDITEDFDYDNKALYLKRGASYRVIFTFSDQGGLKEMSWLFPTGVINPGERTNAAGIFLVANSGDPYKSKLQWTSLLPDDATEVYRSNIITCSDFKAVGGPLTGSIEDYEFEIDVIDLRNNQTNRKLVMRITNEGSRIGSRD